jgi:hypothetical protein
MKWVRYVVGALGQARYTMQIARTDMIPPYALMHQRTGTPVYATVAVTLGSARLRLLHQHALHLRARRGGAPRPPILRRRDHVALGAAHIRLLPGARRVLLHRDVGVLQLEPGREVAGVGRVRVVWAAGTAGMALGAKKQREPKVYGVPLMPWLPATSVATNLFLMGSLGSMAYICFGICMVVMLVYYVLFGVHATYDMAHSAEEMASATVAGDSIDQGKVAPPV